MSTLKGANELYGWTGKLLRIDLSTQQIREEAIPEKVLHQFIGGKGLGTYYLYREVPPRINPLDPSNRFYLAAGPAQGTHIPITGRIAAVSKSPLTRLYIDSQMGGYLGPQLKRAGYDLLIIQGQSETPVWIHIGPKGHMVNDATKFWGKSTHETELALRKEDPHTQVISIGPAGEHCVRFACLTHFYFRNFGRGGLGAVFGAKRLKAIAIQAERKWIPTPDSDKELALVKKLAQRSRKAKQRGHSLHYHGTPWLVDYANSIGMFPTRNFQTAHFEMYKEISDENLDKKYHDDIRRTPCEGCVISCAWTFKKPGFKWARPSLTGKVALPEYETLCLLGGNLGIADPLTIIHANHLCNTLGLDTISTGNVIGFLMELSHKGLLPDELKGFKLDFGDAQGVLKILPAIANREGLGDALAQGTRQFASELGIDAQKVAIHTKGLEYPAWDPRGKLGLGLSYATAAAGASHLRGWPSTTKPPKASAITVLDSLIEQQNLKVLKDSLIICHFTHSISPKLGIKDCAEILETTTGVNTTIDSVNELADRIWLLARMFNIREYDDTPRQYDRLPYRFMHEPIPDGPTKGYTAFISPEDFEESLTELYKRRGCDSDGYPTKAAIHALELAKITSSS